MPSRTAAVSRPPARRWGAAFFLLLAVTPVVPYIKISHNGLAFNDVPPILAVLCGSIAVMARYRRNQPVSVSLVAVLTAEIALIAGASAVHHGLSLGDLLAGPIRWTETTLLIALAFMLGGDRSLLSLFLRTATIVATADALFGLAAFVAGYSGPYYIGIERFRSYQSLYGVFPGRITGTLGLPSNAAGALFALVLPIALGYFLSAPTRRLRIRWAFSVMTLTVALMFTFDRVSIALGIGLVVVLLGLRLSPKAAVLVGGFSLLVIFASPLGSRFTGDSNDRLALWTAAVDMIRANPLLGVGPDRYAKALPEFQNTPFGLATTTAHNSVLEAGATLGILGGLLLSAAIIASLAWLPAALRGRAQRPEVLGAWLGLVGFAVSSLTVNFFFWPQIGLLFWTMAMAVSRSTSAPRSPAGSDPRVAVRRASVDARRAVAAGPRSGGISSAT